MRHPGREGLRFSLCALGRGFAILVPLVFATCAEPPAPADGNLHVAFDIAGRVQRRDVRLSHAADGNHACGQPRRLRLPTASDPAPAANEPANVVFGYAVQYGPRFLPEADGMTPEWRAYGPQQRFAVEVFPRPGALRAEGPVRTGRAFRIAIGTPEGLWERHIAEDDPASAGRVTIARDGLSGTFRATGLVRQIPHNRLPDSEAISVTGSWRCPAPA